MRVEKRREQKERKEEKKKNTKQINNSLEHPRAHTYTRNNEFSVRAIHKCKVNNNNNMSIIARAKDTHR